jgi:hypothetical protein
MNYIIHLNVFLEKAAKEKWMVPHHYSLYMVLFNTWNRLGFRKNFSIRRDEVMQAAKIKSKSTYYRCLKELDAHQYLVYYASAARQYPAIISIVPLDGRKESREVPPFTPNGHPTVPPVVPLLQTNIKLISNEVSNGLPSQEEVVKFFLAQHHAREEALKFWYHHEATGWLTGNTPVLHWQPLAQKWMLNAATTKTNNDEDYDQSF